jgi:membrane fusion protein, heavy metal efflux system
MIRLLVAFLVGAAVAVAAVGGLPALRGAAKPPAEAASADKKDADDNLVKLTPEQITAAGITLAQVDKAELVRRTLVPATIVPHADRVARVSVKLTATVAELHKKVGDPVEKGEVLAILESREVADAKSEFLAARLTNDLEQDLYQRDKVLWQSKFATEQQYLRSRTTAARAKVALDIARQKLIALGLREAEIAALPDQPEGSLRFQTLVSPLAGRVVERRVELGQALGRDNLETELFTVADLSTVWVDMAVSASDLPAIVLGQRVTVGRRNAAEKAEGRIIFVSPMLDKGTRTARVVAELDNSDGVWRPGLFVTAAIASDARPVPLAVPVSALQSIGGQRVVFVRTADGFEKRAVSIGHSDEQIAEVIGGLKPAESVAASNTFLLKSELLKGGVED